MHSLIVRAMNGWLLAALMMCGSANVVAQSRLRPGTIITIAPAFQSWRFADPVQAGTLRVSSVSQLSLPFSFQTPIRATWTFSATGAAAVSHIDASSSNGKESRSLAGPSDIRLRTSGQMYWEGVYLTVGVNLPTGVVGLSPAKYDVLRVVAAPALHAQVPVAGLGFGGTVGAIFLRPIGDWAWAAGAGVEQRGRYAPVESGVTGAAERIELNPGLALHLSLGGEGLVGQHRLSVGVASDFYGTDRVKRSLGTANEFDNYHLGPTASVSLLMTITQRYLRDLTLHLSDRYRTSYRGADAEKVAGSNGNYLELGASGLVGAAGRRSLFVGLDFREHSGLNVDEGFIGAALTTVGATVGASVPLATMEWRPSLRLSVGSLNTTHVATTMTSITLGLTVNAR